MYHNSHKPTGSLADGDPAPQKLGFADMTIDQAAALQGSLYTLFHLEPRLWENCGRGEAALAAFVASVPEGIG